MKNNIVKQMVKMRSVLERLAKEEDGMGIVEIAIIILVIISLALLFQEEVEAFLVNIFEKFDIGSFSSVAIESII